MCSASASLPRPLLARGDRCLGVHVTAPAPLRPSSEGVRCPECFILESQLGHCRVFSYAHRASAWGLPCGEERRQDTALSLKAAVTRGSGGEGDHPSLRCCWALRVLLGTRGSSELIHGLGFLGKNWKESGTKHNNSSLLSLKLCGCACSHK